jgi:hypothetical protein
VFWAGRHDEAHVALLLVRFGGARKPSHALHHHAWMAKGAWTAAVGRAAMLRPEWWLGVSCIHGARVDGFGARPPGIGLNTPCIVT